jgi:hypothetical protein
MRTYQPRSVTEVYFEQYKILSTSFNDEITRFWSRFNILMGIQMGGFIGILASPKLLFMSPELFRLTLILMSMFSVSTTFIVFRGCMMHGAILRMLAMMEQDSKYELGLVRLAWEVSSISIGIKSRIPIGIKSRIPIWLESRIPIKLKFRIPIGLNQIIASVIAVAFSVVWLVFFFIAKENKYDFTLPANTRWLWDMTDSLWMVGC